MKSYLLLPSQRAEIFKILKRAEIDPALIIWRRPTSRHCREEIDVLTLPSVGFSFSFDWWTDGKRFSEYSPGSETVYDSATFRSWDQQFDGFRDWCLFVRRELKSEDPWADLERQKINFGLVVDDQTTAQPFTVSEYKKILQTTQVIQALLITYAKESLAAQEQIKASIARLEAAAETQDRRSWFQQAVGLIISTAVSLALAPEQTKELFKALKDGLQGVIHLIGP